MTPWVVHLIIDLSQSEGERVLEGLCWVSRFLKNEGVSSLNIQKVASALIVVQLSFRGVWKAGMEDKQTSVDRRTR